MIATMPPSFAATNDEREPNFKARRAKWDTREKEYNTNVVYIRNTPLSNKDFMLYSLILGILNIVLSRRRPTSTVLYLEIVVSFSRLGRGGCGRGSVTTIPSIRQTELGTRFEMANQFDGADGWFRIDCSNSLREKRCTSVLFGTSVLFDALADRCAKARLERLERNLSHVLAPQESQIGASVSLKQRKRRPSALSESWASSLIDSSRWLWSMFSHMSR